MPVGVPFVEYQLPGNPDPEWINMYNALYRERMLFLCQEIEDTIANELIGLMLYLNAEDPERALFLYINSPGGSVTCGIGMYDIMRYLHSGITTICMGTAASMASFILAGGTYGRRIALPNSRIMIHQPEGGSDGQATEIVSESTEVTRIRRQIGLIYANRTQQSIERIAEDLDRDQFMSAAQARAYGLVDSVALLTQDTFDVSYDAQGYFDTSHIPGFLKRLYQPDPLEMVDTDASLMNGAAATLASSIPIFFTEDASGSSVSGSSSLMRSAARSASRRSFDFADAEELTLPMIDFDEEVVVLPDGVRTNPLPPRERDMGEAVGLFGSIVDAANATGVPPSEFTSALDLSDDLKALTRRQVIEAAPSIGVVGLQSTPFLASDLNDKIRPFPIPTFDFATRLFGEPNTLVSFDDEGEGGEGIADFTPAV